MRDTNIEILQFYFQDVELREVVVVEKTPRMSTARRRLFDGYSEEERKVFMPEYVEAPSNESTPKAVNLNQVQELFQNKKYVVKIDMGVIGEHLEAG